MRKDLQLPDLMNVDHAVARILDAIQPLGTERVALLDALGRVLAEPLVADLSLPPFANSSMDGFAVRAADLTAASAAQPVTLRVVADIPAGAAPTQAISAGEAARIMTGAPLPPGADAVVPVEQTDQNLALWRRRPAARSGGDLRQRQRGRLRPSGRRRHRSGRNRARTGHDPARAGTRRAGSARSSAGDGDPPPACRGPQQW